MDLVNVSQLVIHSKSEEQIDLMGSQAPTLIKESGERYSSDL